MSDRRPPAFSLVAALADRAFADAGIHAEGRRRDRVEITPRSGATVSVSTANTGRCP